MIAPAALVKAMISPISHIPNLPNRFIEAVVDDGQIALLEVLEHELQRLTPVFVQTCNKLQVVDLVFPNGS
ncbi:MAG: hypothetical protein AAAC50_05190 [Rhizobium altiplani]|uniref:hypothetical protein n=1 Tax=Rhizobium altiplani TaxID=1864509 RepID=UPI0013AF53B4